MEKIMKGYVFRLYPNEEKQELIEKSFGVIYIFIIICQNLND